MGGAVYHGGLWNLSFRVWEFVSQVVGEEGRGLWSIDCGVSVFFVNGVGAGE
jgi:hypothetical protein